MKSKQRVQVMTLAMALGFYGAAPAALATGAGHVGHDMTREVGHEGKAENVSRTVDVVFHDNYFEPEQLSVKPGETIRFRLRNDGGLVHQFSLGTPGMHEANRDTMQMMVEHGVIASNVLHREHATMDMGNGHTMAIRAPGSLILAPGERGEMVWQFGQPTTIEFACNVPGHYQAGMVGEINFQ